MLFPYPHCFPVHTIIDTLLTISTLLLPKCHFVFSYPEIHSGDLHASFSHKTSLFSAIPYPSDCKSITFTISKLCFNITTPMLLCPFFFDF